MTTLSTDSTNAQQVPVQPFAFAPDSGISLDHTGCENRFRSLLGEEDWMKLPFDVRTRFSKKLGPDAWALYRGRVVYTRFSFFGRIFAQVCRLAGGPLPICDVPDMPALVAVRNSDRGNSQTWTRMYGRPGRFHQVVHSEKRFSGPTGLEEYVGYGIGMALTLHVEEGALAFRSAHYFFEIFGRRLRLPNWLSPGAMEIVHRAEDGGSFSFALRLTHPVAGRLVTQLAIFMEVE